MIRRVESLDYKINWSKSGTPKARILNMCSSPSGGVMTGLTLSLSVEVDRLIVGLTLATIYIHTQGNLNLTEIGCLVVNTDTDSDLHRHLLNKIARIKFPAEGDSVTIG